MHKNLFIAVVSVLFIASIYFIGSGINGLSVGESCCYGPNCLVENACDSTKLKEKANVPINLFAGVFFLIAAFAFMLAYARNIEKAFR